MYMGCAGKTVRSLENAYHLSALEVWLRQGAIQIHVYLYLYHWRWFCHFCSKHWNSNALCFYSASASMQTRCNRHGKSVCSSQFDVLSRRMKIRKSGWLATKRFFSKKCHSTPTTHGGHAVLFAVAELLVNYVFGHSFVWFWTANSSTVVNVMLSSGVGGGGGWWWRWWQDGK